jgi:Kazal-type serine protease inhibitor domain
MNTGRIIATALVLALTSCTVAVDEPAPAGPGIYPPPPNPRPGICTREYRPVCGVRGYGERQTFPNACTAEVEGYRIVQRGECRPIRPPQSDDGVTVCPQIYAPVCARQGSVLRTFPNECQAEGSGFRVIDEGDC